MDGGSGGELADDGNQGGAQEGRALAADVHQAEVFATALRRDDFAEIRPAQGLNAALEHAHEDGQNPELPLTFQEDRKEGNACIGQNTQLDQLAGVLRSGETAEENGEGKGHKLGDEQSQQQPRAVQA